jgi:protein phosphatase
MQDPLVAIQCTNSNCQAANTFANKLCHQCHTPLVKRYLWILGKDAELYQVGDCLDDRYLVVQPRIVLDIYPGLPPKIAEEIPPSISTYLKLSALKPHLPQVYGLALTSEEQEVWLLEYGTVPLDATGKLECPALLPSLIDLWQQQTSLRQLNWLWQMAQLWQPLAEKDVAATLLQPELLRVNGPFVQILALEFDKESPSLADLGKFWSSWIFNCHPSLKEFCTELCDRLQSKQIETIEKLVAICEVAIQRCGQAYYCDYQIFTSTDSGPMRERNEDSCYPEPGQLVQVKEMDKPVAIVCDGVGGHEGGEIASRATIDHLKEKLTTLSIDTENWNSAAITANLYKFVCGANDLISSRNDSEKRHQRQRMGTTLVMAFARAHEMYITHVGDSRVYWITRHSCHQLTVDDDLASREVRLGYAIYRDATQYPSAGALVQALGMSSSDNLSPNIQHLVLDEDSIFLLCSDGLSDFDRVEQYWDIYIQPVLNYNTNIAKAGRDLIKIANDRNGHDNVTIALVYCQVQPPDNNQNPLVWSEITDALDRFVPPPPRVSQIKTINSATTNDIVYPPSEILLSSKTKPQPMSSPIRPTQVSSSSSNQKILYLILFLLSVGVGLLAYFHLNAKQNRSNPTRSPELQTIPLNPQVLPSSTITPSPKQQP